MTYYCCFQEAGVMMRGLHVRTVVVAGVTGSAFIWCWIMTEIGRDTGLPVEHVGEDENKQVVDSRGFEFEEELTWFVLEMRERSLWWWWGSKEGLLQFICVILSVSNIIIMTKMIRWFLSPKVHSASANIYADASRTASLFSNNLYDSLSFPDQDNLLFCLRVSTLKDNTWIR